MLGDERLAEERPHRVAEDNDRDRRLLCGYHEIEVPKVADDSPLAVPVGESAEVGRRCGETVATMVVGVSGLAGSVERRREARVAGRMFGEAVGDLDNRPRRPLGRPAPAERRAPSSA